MRSPLVVWGPGLLAPDKAGSVNRESFLAEIDLAPSLLAIADVPAPPTVAFDGVPMADVLLGHSTRSRGPPLFFRRPPDRDSFYGVKDLPDLAVREGRWKLLCEYDGSSEELYDLATDRGEQHNVASDRANTVARLKQELLAWNRSMPQDNGATYRPAPRRRRPATKPAK